MNRRDDEAMIVPRTFQKVTIKARHEPSSRELFRSWCHCCQREQEQAAMNSVELLQGKAVRHDRTEFQP